MPELQSNPGIGAVEPSAAERARTAVHLSGPLTLYVAGGPAEARGRQVPLGGVDAEGAPLLVLEVEDPLVAAVRGVRPDADDVPAVVEVADLCPLPVPEPVRSQVWLAGWLTELTGEERTTAALAVADRNPAPELLDIGTTRTVLRLELGQVLVGTGAPAGPGVSDVAAVDVDVEVYAAAAPDPIADEEAAHLAHLAYVHAEDLALLAALADPDGRGGPDTVVPERLDRYGLGLCVRGAAGWRHHRLPFGAPLARADELPGAMQALLREAIACCSRHRAGPPR